MVYIKASNKSLIFSSVQIKLWITILIKALSAFLKNKKDERERRMKKNENYW